MKKIFLAISLFISYVSFGQNTAIQNFDQTLRNGATITTARIVNQNGNNFSFTGGGNHQLDSILFTNNTNMQLHAIPDSISAYGNSITVGQGATTPTVGGYAYLLATYYSLPINNHALSGSGAWNAIKNHNIFLNPGELAMDIWMFGLNDVRRSATFSGPGTGHGTGSIGAIPAITTRKITNAINAMFVNKYMTAWQPAGSGTGFTRYGTWTTAYNSAAVGGKSHVDGISTGAYTSTLGDSIVFTFTGTNCAWAGIGSDGVTNTYSDSIQIFIDNVLQKVVSEDFQTDAVSDGVYDNARSPMAFFFTGLSAGTHKLKLVNRNHTSLTFVVDYFATLVSPSVGEPVLFFEAPKLDSTGYATAPADANDSVIGCLNKSIDSTVALFPAGYPVSIVKTNSFYSVANISADHIHPADAGHAQIAVGGETVLPLSSLQGITGGTTNQIGNMSFVSNLRYTVNTANGLQQFAYLSDISGGSGLTGTSGTIIKFGSSNTGVNSGLSESGSVLTSADVINVTGAVSLNPAYTVGAAFPIQAGVITSTTFPALSWHNSSAGTDLKNYDEFVDNSGNFNFRLTNDANSTATDWMKYTRVGIVPISGELDIYSVTGFPNAASPTNTAFIGESGDFAVVGINRNPVLGTITQTSKASSEIGMEGSTTNGRIHFYTNNTVNAAPTEAMVILGTHQLLLDSYGVGTFTGTVAKNLGVDASGNVIETSLTKSGTYAPTIATSTNCSAATQTVSFYTQNGTIYHVRVRGSVTATAPGDCSFTISLPSGTNTNVVSNLGEGIVNSGTTYLPAEVDASSGSLMIVHYIATGTGATTYGVSFDYSN
jgi:hypothetical protein